MRIVEALAHQPGASTSQNAPPLFAMDIYASIKSAMPPICAAAEVEAEPATELEMEQE